MKPLHKDLLVCLVLSVLSVVCFYPTFSCYFLEDDLFHIEYLTRLFDGDYWMLWRNFVGIWGEKDAYGFYFRPLLSVFLAMDYLVWRANPLGYHLTNLALHLVCSVLVFFLSKQLWFRFEGEPKRIASFLSAVFFATYPLHGEPVIWVSGRADLACTAFYLACLYFWLRGRSDTKSSAFAMVMFMLALMTKEMAATIPIVLSVAALFERDGDSASLKRKTLMAIRATRWYWIVLLVYLVWRSLAIGELVGGYKGPYEMMAMDFAPLRLFVATACLYPIQAHYTAFTEGVAIAYRSLYLLLGFAIGLRIFLVREGLTYSRGLMLTGCGLLLALALVIPAIYLDASMQGGRLFYLPVAFAAMFFGFLFAELESSSSGKSDSRVRFLEISIRCVLVAYLLLNAVSLAYNTNAWKVSSDRLLDFQKNAIECIKQCKTPYAVIIGDPNKLGYPRLYSHADQAINLFKPPHSTVDISNRVRFVEPWFITEDHFVNRANLDYLATRRDLYTIYRIVDCRLEKLVVPTFPGTYMSWNAPLLLEPTRTKRNGYILKPPGLINPYLYDFLEINTTISPPVRGNGSYLKQSLWWRSSKQISYLERDSMNYSKKHKGGSAIIVRYLGEWLEWLDSSDVSELFCGFDSDDNDIRIERAIIYPPYMKIPKIVGDDSTTSFDYDGVWRPVNLADGKIRYDCHSIKGATKCRVEISIPLGQFQWLRNTYLTRKDSRQVMKSIVLEGRKGELALQHTWFPRRTIYQIRVCALDNTDRIVGFYSFPISYEPGAQNKNPPANN